MIDITFSVLVAQFDRGHSVTQIVTVPSPAHISLLSCNLSEIWYIIERNNAK